MAAATKCQRIAACLVRCRIREHLGKYGRIGESRLALATERWASMTRDKSPVQLIFDDLVSDKLLVNVVEIVVLVDGIC